MFPMLLLLAAGADPAPPTFAVVNRCPPAFTVVNRTAVTLPPPAFTYAGECAAVAAPAAGAGACGTAGVTGRLGRPGGALDRFRPHVFRRLRGGGCG